MGRHIWIVVLCVLAGAGIGLAYGLLRKPHYTAEARVSIGQLNLSTQGVPGFVSAASSLAAAYARAVDAPAVTQSASSATGMSVADARDALSGSSIPNSPIFRIDASTTDSAKSVQLVNTASKALLGYVVQINTRAALRSSILVKYKRAADRVAIDSVEAQRAAKAFAKSRSARNRASLIDASTRRQVAILRRDSLQGIYATAAGGELAENLLQVIVPADHADSDKRKKAEQYAGIGALAGLVLGIALAATRENRLVRRRAAA